MHVQARCINTSATGFADVRTYNVVHVRGFNKSTRQDGASCNSKKNGCALGNKISGHCQLAAVLPHVRLTNDYFYIQKESSQVDCCVHCWEGSIIPFKGLAVPRLGSARLAQTEESWCLPALLFHRLVCHLEQHDDSLSTHFPNMGTSTTRGAMGCGRNP